MLKCIMKRKLVRQGSSTLMISLPSKWVKSNNLDKGSEIDIDEKENVLEISVERKEKKSRDKDEEIRNVEIRTKR